MKIDHFRGEYAFLSNFWEVPVTYQAPDRVQLQLCVYRKGTNRLYSNFLPTSDAEEMIQYLCNPASHQTWLEQIGLLSDSVDDYWD